MHTRDQLTLDAFNVTLDGDPADILVQWGANDRLGVLVDRPLGGLGASLAIQLATAAFYEVDGRHSRALYPDHYLFHVGGRWGDFSAFDFWPERREIFLPADSGMVLDAINDRAITHLLAPDGPVQVAALASTEVQSAQDRLRVCLAYGCDGAAPDGDVIITTHELAGLDNALAAVDMRALLQSGHDPEATDLARWRARVVTRLGELSEQDRAGPAARIRAAVAESRLEERYRRCSVNWALGRLCGDATQPLGRSVE
jgi:hypothetical protein